MRSTAASTGSSVLDEVAGAIGFDAAARLAGAFAGQRIYVPRELPGDHPITAAIGAEAGALLVEHFHRTHLQIPIRQAREARVKLLAERQPPLTANQIAAEVGITARGVRKILGRDSRHDDRQRDLFDQRG